MEAKLAKDLMEAYASVYAQPEEVLTESDCECEDEEKSEKETPEMNGKKKEKKKKEDEMKEEVETDLFDIILEYLVAEGYADTNQSALVIMANMSEDWKKSILEEVDSQGNRSHDLFTGKPNPNYKPGNVKPKPQVKKEPPDREDGPLF